IFVAILKEAASNAKPTKYAQNKRHGMYEGTLSMMNLAPERCSAPKTAKGMAKHKLVTAMILSRPPARAISVFAAHSATRKSRTAGLDLAIWPRKPPPAPITWMTGMPDARRRPDEHDDVPRPPLASTSVP